MVVTWRKAEDGNTGTAKSQRYVRVLRYIEKIRDIKLFAFNPVFCKICDQLAGRELRVNEYQNFLARSIVW